MKEDHGQPCVQYVAMSVDKDLNVNKYTTRGATNICSNEEGLDKTQEGSEV